MIRRLAVGAVLAGLAWFSWMWASGGISFASVRAGPKAARRAGAFVSELDITGDLAFGTVAPDTELAITLEGDGSQIESAGRLAFSGDTTTFQIVTVGGDPEDTPFLCEGGDYYFAMSGAGTRSFTFATRLTDELPKSMTVSLYNGDGTLDDSRFATATVTAGCTPEHWWCDEDGDGYYFDFGFTVVFCETPDPECLVDDPGPPGSGVDCEDMNAFFTC